MGILYEISFRQNNVCNTLTYSILNNYKNSFLIATYMYEKQDNFPPDNFPPNNCPLNNCPPDNCHLGQLPPEQFPTRTIASWTIPA